MTVNWNEIGQQLNSLLHNYAEFVDKYYQFFTGPAQDVHVEYYDINGNPRQANIPSVAKLRDRFISDVNSAMSKTVYVDAENGSDSTGDGSQGAPFKSLRKAVDSVPVGGYGTIIFTSPYILRENVNLYGKNIVLKFPFDVNHDNGEYHMIIDGGSFRNVTEKFVLCGEEVRTAYFKVTESTQYVIFMRGGSVFGGGYYGFHMDFSDSQNPQYLIYTSYHPGDDASEVYSYINFVSFGRAYINASNQNSRLVYYDYAGKVLSYLWQCSFPENYDNTTHI